ncbi:serine-rich adhesin for platelets-like isoform X2 [Topomyia yanbarensis]|nr:serine-rich adhesin for platelets-like isoform X2 [Topomyia yanbarensis]
MDNAKLNEILSISSASIFNHIPPYCVKAIKNTRRKMEDRNTCISDFNGMFHTKDSEPTSFYGVFDGHGGQDAAVYTSAHLGYNIANSTKYPKNILGAIREAFLKTDEDFIAKSEKHAIFSGTTALVCLHRAIEKKLFFGWVGDSQALLACEGKVCQIISPHIPSIESERIRIENTGGVVVNWKGSCRVNGLLAVSRAIGDASHKPFIISDPDTSLINLEGKEDFLIIASDGLWESLSEDAIALLVYRQLAANPGCADTIADTLIESARKGTTDNITVVLVFLKDPNLIAKSIWLSNMEAACDKNNTTFENEVISPTLASNQNNDESKEEHLTNERPIIQNIHRFEDDFGPETDVDGQEDATLTNTSAYCGENNISEKNLSNSVKNISLENKILKHLSEQNKDFLADSNPFKNENSNESHDLLTSEMVLLDQPTTQSGELPRELSVDNKIIDALEALGVTNGKKENHDIIDKTGDSTYFGVGRKSPDLQDILEKVDYTHEKNVSISEELKKCVFPDKLEPNMEQGTSHTEMGHIPIADTDSLCAAAESEEEEDEWNYIEGVKKLTHELHRTTNEETKLVSEIYDPVDQGHTADLIQKFTYIDEPKAHIALTPITALETEKTDGTKDENIELSTNQEESSLGVGTVVPEIAENPQEQDQLESQQTEQNDSLLYVASPKSEQLVLSTAFEKHDAFAELSFEKETFGLESISVLDTIQEQTVQTITETETEIGIDKVLERPDNLSFEMASKLNPEAKEFIPTGSPCRSDPTSPVENIPTVLQNSYLMLSDDTVIAQSPKKGGNTMDNIDVPAEIDFQHEMSNRPHEFELKSEFTNGNVDAAVRLHSPASEPSYQEMNLKEAMQCDEKLEYEYNDEQQTLTENICTEGSNEDLILNVLSKESNAMNTSFYEGRGEVILSSNSDVLNKVHLLPDEEELIEQINNHYEPRDSPRTEEHVSDTRALELFAVENESLETQDLLQTTIEESNSEPHLREEPSASVFTVAVQVVNDVSALLNEMQFASPVIGNISEIDETQQKSALNEGLADIKQNLNSLDAAKNDKIPVTLINLDMQNGANPREIISEMEHHCETKEFQLPVETLQQTIVTEMKPLVNVQSSVMFSGIAEKHLKTFSDMSSIENTTGKLADVLDAELNNFVPVTKVPVSDIVQLNNKAKSVDNSAGVALVTAMAPTTSKSVASKVGAPRIATKTAATSVDKKVPTSLTEPLAKSLTKPTTLAKSMTALKKNAASSSQGNASGSKQPLLVIKSPTVAAARSSVSNKIATEKKVSLTAKKPLTTTAVNGDSKAVLTIKKVPTSAPKVISTTTTTSSTSARPSSTTSKSATTPKLLTGSTTRTTSSASSRTSTTISRTSNALPSAKHRIVPPVATKTIGSDSTSKTSVASSVIKKISSSAQSATQRTPATNKTSTSVSKSTSRTSTTLKPSNPTTILRKSNTNPNKNPTSTPVLKIGAKTSPSGKSVPTKSAISNLDEIILDEERTKNLLDIEEHLTKGNQRIINNGTDWQMTLNDSAED